jgi:hypothetical protein
MNLLLGLRKAQDYRTLVSKLRFTNKSQAQQSVGVTGCLCSYPMPDV